MFFYVIQLFNQEYKDDIILALTSAGVIRATIVEGNNLDRMLDADFPLFTGFFRGPDDRERRSLLFFGMVEDEEKLSAMADLLDDAGVDNEDGSVYRVIAIKGASIR